MNDTALILAVAGFATLGVILRPLRVPEYVWAVIGAVALVAFGLLPWRDALSAAEKGSDVYLFLIGMMLLAEVARLEGLFDWLAALAVRHAKGSAKRLFLIVYAVGTLVTVLLSNDATAVVLTPAVYAAATAARVEPLPYLFICAFIANAASFVLPISNPANLVIFGAHMPPLAQWLYQFTLPSMASILVTYWLLRFTQRTALHQAISTDFCGRSVVGRRQMHRRRYCADSRSPSGRFGAGPAARLADLHCGDRRDRHRAGHQPAVAEAGAAGYLMGRAAAGGRVVRAGRGRPANRHPCSDHARASRCCGILSGETGFAAGVIVAFLSNLMNNLPTGLVAATVSQSADVPLRVTSGILIGVDLGPNLSVTGSLATILWLIALRRDGEIVTAWQFLRLGIVIMPPALLAALSVLAIWPWN